VHGMKSAASGRKESPKPFPPLHSSTIEIKTLSTRRARNSGLIGISVVVRVSLKLPLRVSAT